ncbi:MAG: ribonucleoside-diphosphate reductase, adenosylcobalamin-dependent [Thermoplasmata archaeon]|nr:ribonucleoside-diphosphate reductase, adenosylcobalamin-dependent [Thermoplasmata archaeon]
MQASKHEGELVDDADSGLVIERRFTVHGKSVYDQFKWSTADIDLKDAHGNTVRKIENVNFPSGFDGVPVKVAADKYLRKVVPGMDYLVKIPEEGVPEWLWKSKPDETKKKGAKNWKGKETSGWQLFHRMSGCWTYWGWKNGYFASENDARAYYDEMCYLLASQRSAPNSPQWFNTGLHWAYGIEGPAQGHWYVDHITKEDCKSINSYERPQPHACFIQSIEDKLVGEGGITDLVAREALLFKFGSGTGSNFSNIRGDGEPLSGGGQSSGLLSFLMILDKAAGAIKSGGTTRRAAKMVTLDLDHPDIQQYVNWKMKEEEKVSALIAGAASLQKHANAILESIKSFDGTNDEKTNVSKNIELAKSIKRAVNANIAQPHIKRLIDLAKQGYTSMSFEQFDADWQGSGYLTVSGQNSNNSVRVPNKFMEAVESNGDWNLYWRTEKNAAEEEGREPVPSKTMPAQELWDEISLAAWSCADPGVQFDTTINDWHTCPDSGRINGSNPCSEYMFLDNTACNLASINLLHFYDKDRGALNIDDYVHSIRLWTATLEISVLMAQFPSKQISRLSYETRTLGLGLCNIGSLLMHMGIPYDDPRGYAICGALTSIMTGEAYKTSAEMSSFLGPFQQYEANSEHMMKVMRNHRRAAYDANPEEYENLSVTPMGINAKNCPNDILEAARSSWDQAVMMGEEHGYRNAQTTVIAPTGTIGLVMGCDTTGVEPMFSIVQYKTLAGGGTLRIPATGLESGLSNLGYSKSNVKDIINYVMGTGTFSGCSTINTASLMKHGFTEEEFSKMDNSFNDVFDVRSLASPNILGDDFCIDVLGLTEDQLADPFIDVLSLLGYSSSEIQVANDYLFGKATIEGAPHIKENHLAVFDCAQPCGAYGTRSIRWESHVDMMAAAQPFISGAISKTINMPGDVTIEDVQEAYLRSWKTGNKACALYRDGSKLSQPLMSSLVPPSIVVEDEEDEEEIDLVISQVAERLPLPKPQATAIAQAIGNSYVATRRPLPDCRESNTMKARVGGHTVYLTSSTYDDGKVGEIMITTSKEGAAWRSMLNQFAIAVSIGLQYGVPLEAFVKSFTFQKFEPSGMVQGGSNRVKMATSIVDYLFRELAIQYLNRDDLAQVSAEDLDAMSISRPESTPDGVVRYEGEKRDIQLTLDVTETEEQKRMRLAREQGFTGDICGTCGGSKMQRSGTCLKCAECGSTTGCS